MLRCSVLLALLLLQPVLAGMGPGGGDGGSTLTTTSAVTVTLSAPAASTPSPSSNGTRTQPAVRPAVTPPAPSMALAMPSNATTCTPATFRWQTTPSSTNTSNVNLRLFITNDQVQQSAPSNVSVSAASDDRHAMPITRAITNNTALASGSFSWPAVSVPSGWYKLLASLSSEHPSQAIAQSAPFFVTAGSNTSCVYPNPSTLQAQSHSRLTPGALAGTVVGSVVGAAALLGAFALPRLWRRGVPGHQAWKDKRGGLYRVF